MALIDIKVPDIGDFKDVAVIEVLVKPGDTVKVEQSLITLESDKATMEIPSSHAGVVKEMKVKVGDKVNEGALILSCEAAAGAAAASAPAPGSRRSRCRRRRAARRQPARRPRQRGARRAGLRRAGVTAAATSSATCWCSAPVPAATRPRSAPPTSA